MRRFKSANQSAASSAHVSLALDRVISVSVRSTPCTALMVPDRNEFELLGILEPDLEQIVPGARHVVAFKHLFGGANLLQEHGLDLRIAPGDEHEGEQLEADLLRVKPCVKARDDALSDQPLDPIIDRRGRDAGALAQLGERQSVVVLQQRQKLAVDIVKVAHGSPVSQMRPSPLHDRQRDTNPPSGM